MDWTEISEGDYDLSVIALLDKHGFYTIEFAEQLFPELRKSQAHLKYRLICLRNIAAEEFVKSGRVLNLKEIAVEVFPDQATHLQQIPLPQA